MALARGIASLPAPDRAFACQTAFERAHVADKYRKRFGRLHPTWGNGSVMGFAMLAYRTRTQDDLQMTISTRDRRSKVSAEDDAT